MKENYRNMWEEALANPALRGIKSTEKKYFNRIEITKNYFPESDSSCYTFSVRNELFGDDRLKEKLIEELCRILNGFMQKYRIDKNSPILVAGLGNEHITADSLGGAVIDKLYVTSHLYSEKSVFERFGNLSGIKCGVSGTTGIASFDILSGVAERIRPSLIIAVDALACSSVSRLGKTIQISDAGIEPGGGVANPKPKLDRNSLGVPVIAVGVPLVVFAKKILAEYVSDNAAAVNADEILSSLVVTAKEIDFQVADFSYVIAESLNRTVHGGRS